MNKRGFLAFGIDHLTINIGLKNFASPEDLQSLEVYKLFQFLNSQGLNDTNTSDLHDIYWDSFGKEIDVFCDYSPYRNISYSIHVGRYRIMRIEYVPTESTLKQSLHYKYDYRITFYGTLFALSRIKKLDHFDFINPFLRDSLNDFVRHSISRIDLACDVFGITPSSVLKGLIGTKEKQKKVSKINENQKTKEVETIYYGKGSGNDWCARFYNKLLDIAKKGKEKLYPDYLDYETVTRIEIECKSPVAQRFKLSLEDVYNIPHLFSIYKQHLETKYSKFKIIDFIDQEFKKLGYQEIKAEKTQLSYENYSKIERIKRLKKSIEKFKEDYEETNETVKMILFPP